MDNSDKEIIEFGKKARARWLRFLSNPGKPERERWVVREFLASLSVEFAEDEIISQDERNDIDIVFRELNFQVKELTEPNCRRGSEAADDLRRAESANSASDLFGPSVVKDNLYRDAFPPILGFAHNSRYPRSARARLDLLVYVTDTQAVLDLEKQPRELSNLGWRSISCLFGSRGYVLVAEQHAPVLIRANLFRSK